MKDAKLFVGREEEFGLIKDVLEKHRDGAIIVLAGAPRSGKSSVMEYIVAQQGELAKLDPLWARVIPVLTSIAAMPVGGDVEFYGKLTDRLSQIAGNTGTPKQNPLHEEGSKGATLDFSAIDRAQRAFTDALERVLARHPDKLLLLMLDECQLLELRAREGRMSPGVIPYLAFLKDKHPRLSFILAGPWDLKNQRFEYLETVLRKATQAIELGHLSDEAARKLVTVPVQQKMSYTPEALEYILRLTGRHAFYTQLLCNELVWRLGEREKVTLEDVEAAAEAVVLNPPGMLPIFWADSTPSEQAVLAGLARISFDEEDFAAAGTVYRQIRKSDLKLPVSSVPGGSSHVKCPKCGQEISTSGPAPPATAVEGSAQEMASATLAVHEVATILDDLVRRNILKVRSIFWYNFNVDLLRMWMREGYRL